jgi:multidrug resistance efflux pump
MRSRPPLVRTVLLLAGAFVAATLLALFLVRIERVVVAPGEFTGPSQPVRAARDGVIGEVRVEAGARVEAGTLLARLDARALEAERVELGARRAGLETRRADAERERRHLLEALHPAERASLERGRRASELVLEAARTKEGRYAELHAQGLAEAAALEEMRLARQLAEVELERVLAGLAHLPALEQAALDEIDARAHETTHALTELEAQAAELARRAALGEITAPVAGRVLAPEGDELVGRAVRAGDELLRIATPGVEAFLARLDDRGRARAREGQNARIRLDSYPWLVHGTLQARVTMVAERREAEGYLVRLELEPEGAPGPLYEGMRGRARIATAERASLLWMLVEQLFQLGPR